MTDEGVWKVRFDEAERTREALQAELQETQKGLVALTLELETRVEHRTAELARQRELARQQAAEASLLMRVAETLNSAIGLEEALQISLDQLMELTGAEMAWITLADETRRFRVWASRGLPEELAANLAGQGGLCQCQQELLQGSLRRSQLHFNCSRMALLGLERQGLSIHATVPLLVAGQPLGVINLARREGEPASPEQLRLLTAIGHQVSVAVERTRLFEAEQQKRAELARSNALIAALGQVAAQLEAQADPGRVMETLGDGLKRLGLTFAATLLEGEEQEPVLRYHSITSRALLAVEKLLRRPVVGLPAGRERFRHFDRLFQEKEAIFVADQLPLAVAMLRPLPRPVVARAAQLADGFARSPGLYLPLLVEGQVIGALAVWGPELREEDGPALAIFAAQVGAAFEMARLHQQLQARRVGEQETLLALAHSLVGQSEPQAVMDLAARQVQQALGADLVSIMTPDPSGQSLVLASGAGWEPELIGHYRLDVATSREGYVFRRDEAVQEPDVPGEARFPCPQALRERGVQSSATVPLGGEHGVLGTMCAHSRTRRTLSPDEMRLFALLASITAQALERARLFATVRRQVSELSLLHRLTLAGSEATNEDELIARALEVLCQNVPAELAGINLVDPSDGLIRVHPASRGAPPSLLERAFAPGEGIVGQVVVTGQARRVPHVEQATDYLPVSAGTRSELCLPLKVGDRVIGALNLESAIPDAYSEADERVLATFAGQLATALERMRLLAQLQASEEKYRTMFATAAVPLSEQDFTPAKEALDRLLAQGVADLGAYLEAHPEVVAQIAGQVRLGEANAATLALYGAASREALPATVAELLTPEGLPVFRRELLAIAAGQATFQEETVNRTLSGEERHLLLSMNLAPERGGLSRVLVSLLDITERVRREQEQAALARMATALRAARTPAEMLPTVLDVVMELVPAGGAAFALRDQASGETVIALGRGQWQQVTGVRVGAGQGVTRLVLADGRPFVSEDLRQEPEFQHAHLLADLRAAAGLPLIAENESIGVLWVGRIRPFEEGEVRLLAAVADMVANALYRAQLYEQTQAQARRLRQVMESVPEGVALLDHRYRVLLANPVGEAHLEQLGWSGPGTAVVQLGGQLMPPLLAAASTGLWQELSLGQKKDRRIFELGASRLHEQAGGQWVVVVRDVTEARRHQAYLQAQERMATVGQLAAGIAHDFNNILAIITLYSQMLQVRPDAPKREHYLSTIHQQAIHASNLVSQILDFSRRSLMQRQPTDLATLLENLVAILERTLPASIHVELDYAPEATHVVNGDSTRLQQALMNLAVNARDAMPAGGRLRLRLARLFWQEGEPLPLPDLAPGAWLRLEVADTGTGMEPGVAAHIFEPFFTTKEKGRGTGLGLAQVHGIIKQHDGAIAVESELGRGTSFIIYLPAVDGPAAASEGPGDAPQAAGQGQTILVVEDNDSAREAVHDILVTLGYRVRLASSGEEALALYEEEGQAISLVLSDLVMGGMNGLELCRRLRSRWPEVRLMIMTGYPLDDAGSREMLQSGVVDWVAKPLSLETLAERVARALAGQ